MEMPSRSRLCAEMKKYGQVMDIQQLNKQNAYLFAYADETNATEAKSALESKAHHILRISKVQHTLCYLITGLTLYYSSPKTYKTIPHRGSAMLTGYHAYTFSERESLDIMQTASLYEWVSSA